MDNNRLSAVVFDLDNTLVSSSLNFNQIRQEIGCASNIDLLEFVDNLPEDQRYKAEKTLIEHEIADAQNCFKLAGVDQLLALLSMMNIPTAIITRNCRAAALLKINKHVIDIPILLTREDHKAKPSPDALLHLAERWQKPAQELLYVGDYLYDIQTAQNANAMSCLITYGKQLPYADLADCVVDDLIGLTELVTATFNKQIPEQAS